MIARHFAVLTCLFVASPIFAQQTGSPITSATDPARDSRLRAPDAREGIEPLPVVVELLDDVRDLHGLLLDTADLEVDTAFGIAKMPLEEVLGIRMAREANEMTTIVLHNGDMITGTVDIQNLLVQTSWGKSEVNGANLGSIFFDEGLSWTSLKLLAGERWPLEQDEEIAPTPTPTATSSTGRPTSTKLVSQTQKPLERSKPLTELERTQRPSQSVLVSSFE